MESTWLGSLVENGAGAAGLLYRRNRYYDPQSGRFTQQDPIGIAGGVNVYGFAGGDPVNYSDPFGLCPIPLDDCPPGYFTGLGMLAGSLLGGTGGGAAGLSAGPFAIFASPAGAAAGAIKGAAIGGAVGAAVDGLIWASKSHTVTTVDIPGHGRTRVDWEEPTDDTPGNVHVQGKGRGAVPKTKVESLDDLRSLPRAVRDNPAIRRGVERALEQLRKPRESQ